MINRVRQLVRAGRAIEAIKVYREQTGVGLKEAKDAVDAIARELHKIAAPAAMPNPNSNSPVETDSFRALLTTFAENLTAPAYVEGQSEIYEREAEVAEVLQALASPLKGRVVIIGPHRVGKTAVAQAAARCIARGQGPEELRGHEIWRFTPGGLPGLATPGNWQAALEQLLSEWPQHPEIILYVDEVVRSARLPGGGNDDEDGNSSIDVATLLANGLKRLNGLCLAEAEETAWHRFAETYTDYGRLFLPVRVEGHSVDTARQVVRRVAEDLSILHGVAVAEAALEQALDLSQRYFLDRAQPGKTIDLVRNTLAVAPPNAALSAADVNRRFREQTGLPEMLLDDSAPFNEAEVLKLFKQRVLAQDQAVEAIVQSLSLLRARVNNPYRPMGVFLFLGPTGVGKTELARVLAEYLYGHRDRLVRFNMADYANPYQSAELFGNPYANNLTLKRGQLTNRLAGKVFSVIVLDEFEKAHPFIYQRFLQLFDEGLLINGNDEMVNLRNSIIILTSNFGAQLIEQGRIGFNVAETAEMREKRVLSETEAYFTPEFMNRIDAVCIFHPLTRAVMADIARREIGDLLRRDGLTRRQFEIDLADEVIDQVVALGYSPHYGARYLKRQIEKTITYPLAREINALPAGASGGAIRLYLKHGRIASAYFSPQPADAAETRSSAERAEGGSATLAEIREALPVLAARVEALEELHGLTQARAEREHILAEMSEVSFWDNAEAARRKLDVYQRASSTVDLLGGLRQALDALTAHSQAPAPNLHEMLRPYKRLLSELPRIEFTSWLSGPYDTAGAYVLISIKSKQTAARHWAAALAKMYLGWAKQRRLAASLLGEDLAPDGQTYTAALVISGFGVYGLLRGESGAHRLTQLVKAPGRNETLQRLTATVSVLPELGDDELPEAEVDVAVKDANRGGLLLPRCTLTATARHAERRLTLSGHLLSDDLAAEVARILRLSLLPESAAPLPTPPGGLVRSYTQNTKDKGVHDHRTGQRTAKVKQVLEGDLQTFLDEALKLRAQH